MSGPRCIVGDGSALDAAGIMAGFSEASAQRFGQLLQKAFETLADDSIRHRLPTSDRFVFLPLHRLQWSLTPPRGPKVRHMLLLTRLSSGDWYVLAKKGDAA